MRGPRPLVAPSLAEAEAEMSLSDEEKMIDRAERYEEVRFLKKQHWAVAAAGVVLMGGLLAILKDVHVTPLDKR